MARRYDRARLRTRKAPPSLKPGRPCRSVVGFPAMLGEGQQAIPAIPSVRYAVSEGRLSSVGELYYSAPSGAQMTSVRVQRVDYIGPQGQLILRIMAGAPLPAPSGNVRAIRACYEAPTVTS